MDFKQTHNPKSWEQKESVRTYLTDAPEVYYDEPNLQLLPETHKANDVLEAGQQQHPKTDSTKRQRLWLLSAISTILVCLAIGLGVGLGVGLRFRSSAADSTSMDATSQQ